DGPVPVAVPGRPRRAGAGPVRRAHRPGRDQRHRPGPARRGALPGRDGGARPRRRADLLHRRRDRPPPRPRAVRRAAPARPAAAAGRPLRGADRGPDPDGPHRLLGRAATRRHRPARGAQRAGRTAGAPAHPDPLDQGEDRMTEPPRAKRVPRQRTHHADTVVDEYAWLADRDDPDTLAYLAAENAYTTAATAHLAELRETIFNEIRERTQETDLSVPVRRG